jgi:hypothetical protein
MFSSFSGREWVSVDWDRIARYGQAREWFCSEERNMFVGHLAVAFGVKSMTPRIPLGWLVAASFGLDLLWPVFLLVGIENVRIDPGNTALTPLAFDNYPWSHSLAMVLVWAGLAAALVPSG